MNFDFTRFYLRGWIYHFFGRIDAAYEAYAEAAGFDRDAFQPRCSLAFIAAGRKDHADAERWFRDALRIRPEDSDTWFNLGFVLDEAGRREAAIDAFRESVRTKPQQDRAWYGLGLALAKGGEHAAAAEALARAAELQPMNGVAWYQLGMAHHHNHDPEKLESVIRHLHGFDPKFCRQLIRDSGRSDLEHLVKDMLT